MSTSAFIVHTLGSARKLNRISALAPLIDSKHAVTHPLAPRPGVPPRGSYRTPDAWRPEHV
jgi:hypothetical protein